MNMNEKHPIAEGGKPIRGKGWVISFLLFLLIGSGIYMTFSYRANPLGYFTNSKKLDFNFSDDYTRSIKSIFLKEHKADYDAVVLGGSKAGVLDPALLTEYTGLRYYNMYFNVSNFADYLRTTKFLLRETDIKEITIHLSLFETTAFDQTSRGSNFEVPAVWTGSLYDKVTEYLGYLMTDYATVEKAFKTRLAKGMENPETLAIGMKNRSPKYKAFMTDPDEYVAKNAMKNYDSHLRALFVEHVASSSNFDEIRTQNINALKEMKRLCDAKGVTLKVLFSGGFIGEKYLYECNDFYDYMASITDIIGEVWDFSGYSDILRNPYNFIDNKHISNAMGDLIVNTMYGDGSDAVEGFGFLMTPENVHEHIAERQRDYERYAEEYAQTGTIAVYGMDHESYLPWINECVWSGERDKVVLTDEELAELIEEHEIKKAEKAARLAEKEAAKAAETEQEQKETETEEDN